MNKTNSTVLALLVRLVLEARDIMYNRAESACGSQGPKYILHTKLSAMEPWFTVKLFKVLALKLWVVLKLNIIIKYRIKINRSLWVLKV